MDKYIGFDIDDKKTVACVVQKGKKDIYDTISTDVAKLRALGDPKGVFANRLHQSSPRKAFRRGTTPHLASKEHLELVPQIHIIIM